MGNNKKLNSDVEEVLSNIEEKYILTKEEVSELLATKKGEIVLPVSIFNDRLGMLEAASVYLKDELNLSFNDISKLLKRDYKTIWTSYNKGKKKVKNEG